MNLHELLPNNLDRLGSTTVIVDPRTRRVRQARDIKIAHHELPNPEKLGESRVTKCVEYTVVGLRHSWRDWALFETFKAYNPSIRFDEEQ